MARQTSTGQSGVFIPKVIGGRRITRTTDNRRNQEDHLDFHLPSRSTRTVKYNPVLRVADNHTDYAVPLYTVVISCSCPDFMSHLRQAASLQSSAVTPWCKHVTTLVWFVASDYRVVCLHRCIDPRSASVADSGCGRWRRSLGCSCQCSESCWNHRHGRDGVSAARGANASRASGGSSTTASDAQRGCSRVSRSC